MKKATSTIIMSLFCISGFSQPGKWYTQGNFIPDIRIGYTINNQLDIDRENCPVIISRENFPLPDIHEMWVTVVDPLLESAPMPSKELLEKQGGHELRMETKLKGTLMGCGVRKKPGENNFIRKGGMLISSGPENIKDPESIDDREAWYFPFVGIALVVKDIYNPEYQFLKENDGNYAFRVTPDGNNSFEYMLIAGWSEGVVYNTKEKFNEYANKCTQEYNHPILPQLIDTERKK